MVFSSLLGKRQYPTVFLGSPEAEAEATATSRMPLVDVYEDFHQLLDGLLGGRGGIRLEDPEKIGNGDGVAACQWNISGGNWQQETPALDDRRELFIPG